MLEALMVLCCFPNKDCVPFEWAPSDDPARHARGGNFMITACIFMCDMLSFIIGNSLKEKDASGKLMRQRDVIGKGIVSLLGWLGICFGAAETEMTDATSVGGLTNAFTPLSPAMQCLLLQEKTSKRLLRAKMLLNILSDAGGGTMRILSAHGY